MEELRDARLKEIVCAPTINENGETCMVDNTVKAEGF